MCRERKYKARCGHTNSYTPVIFLRCQNPENFPACITNNAMIDEVLVREHGCKTKDCRKTILPKPLNYAAEITASASSAYRERPRDYVEVPAHISRWFPRRAPSAVPTEAGSNQREAAPVAAPASEPESNQPEISSTYLDGSDESFHPPSHLNLPPYTSSPVSSSSQRTGVIYMENGHIYPFTVYDSVPPNPDWIEMVEGEHYIFENEPNLDDAAREEFRPGVEKRMRTADWIDGVQKKTSSH